MRCGADQVARLPELRRGPANRVPDSAVSAGARLGASDAPSDEPPPVPTPVAAAPELSEERRRATVLFADLSGYTAVAERSIPRTRRRWSMAPCGG